MFALVPSLSLGMDVPPGTALSANHPEAEIAAEPLGGAVARRSFGTRAAVR
jgi:hypothetical protein